MRLVWPALERESRSEKGLGVYRGPPEGEWGVSTLRINPVTNEPYVTLFRSESEAIIYARRRAYQTGPARGRGNIYFVVHTLPYEGDKFGRRKLVPKYRVLRGSRGVTQTKGAGHPYPLPQEFQEQVMVFNNNGVLPNGKIQWKLNKGLTVTVRDVELEREKASGERGTRKMGIWERRGDPEDK